MHRQQRWPERTHWAGGILLAVIVVLLLILIGYEDYPLTTGFGQSEVSQGIQPAKTLWDWLDLLVVPIVLAIGGYLFTRSETQATQVAAERRAQDEALQAYLDQMSAMLIPNKEQPSLYDEPPPDSLRTVARARTLTVLPRLDVDRKARVVQFLYESGLIAQGRQVLDLSGADLSRANLSGANLKEANLSEADLGGANLREANLKKANLMDANLEKANLTDANLEKANLTDANLSGADLIGTSLSGADLSGADLSRTNLLVARLVQANLSGANLKKASLIGAHLSRANLRNIVIIEANLRDANFTDADLSGAYLMKEANLRGAILTREVNLRGAILTRANLSGAYLKEADLSGAVLKDATGWTEELLPQARSLKGTTMPDGQRYEDWLKNKDRREDGGERGPS